MSVIACLRQISTTRLKKMYAHADLAGRNEFFSLVYTSHTETVVTCCPLSSCVVSIQEIYGSGMAQYRVDKFLSSLNGSITDFIQWWDHSQPSPSTLKSLITKVIKERKNV